jgi:peptidoglycan-associated lipoprotein
MNTFLNPKPSPEKENRKRKSFPREAERSGRGGGSASGVRIKIIHLFSEGGTKMEKVRRLPFLWLALLIGLTTVGFLMAGCSKKVATMEEVAGKPPAVAKQEAPPPPKPVEQPKVVAPPKAEPVPPPKQEAAPKVEAKPAPLDLSVLRIQFAFDDYSLSSRSKENLEKIASWLKSNPQIKVQVQGNTCNIGTAEYNLALGDRRAASAKDYLMALGVEASRLATVSYGEEKPRVPNNDEANRSMNRRDEFVVVP